MLDLNPIVLTDGDDVYTGTTGDDLVYANNGNDKLYGRSGEDNFYGGAGNDLLDGGDGNDILTGYGSNGTDGGIEVLGSDILLGGGGDDYMSAGNGNDVLNGGTGADGMNGGNGNDSYYVDNVDDRVSEYNSVGVDKIYSSITYSLKDGKNSGNIENLTLIGSAKINGVGNELDNAIAGNNASNTLFGLQGNDTINGLAGQDVIYGGLGNDKLLGGAGPDRFVFNTPPNTVTNRDVITDFNVSDDNIWLENGVFAALGTNGLLSAGAFHIGAAAHDANDRIIYNSSTGALFYDINGSAAGGSAQFATLSKGLAMTHADFLII